ncbi:uncharacterized protein A1O5_08697 [Cladophialophora psammophila CBS 110553]|uniref:Nephrocystin 3-like N-terminal domain-containing protein n=1 Tax=Cladophialophora psammophila CBS 110553 TaxID=1182543 RepID=W9WIV8_9EURO|nr:uncharacterized protein A1O5_08697 [Cladophialophora psammophila CBS 110553]EXJ68082.1 hypothetical protein A1O5_08697 [Cladophialophora psammophila CBS 110553]
MRSQKKLNPLAAWILLFESGWKSFELRFKNILKNLAYHQDLVDKEATAFNLVEATSYRRKVEEEIAKAEQERESSHLQAVLAWLCVEDILQENNLWRLGEKRLDGTCDWIFNIPQYQAWLKNVDRSPLLWLTGSRGSGKSVFCAHITQKVQKIEQRATLFYYCLHKGDISDKPSIFLQTLVMQITRIYPEFAALIWDTYVQNAQLASNDNLQKLLPDLISGAPQVRIILDGIDEYDVKDCKLILDMLFKLQKKSPVAILISRRDEGLISAKMRKKPRILLNVKQHTVQKGMSIFVASRLDQAIEDYDLNLSDEMKAAGRDELLQKSGGR